MSLLQMHINVEEDRVKALMEVKTQAVSESKDSQNTQNTPDAGQDDKERLLYDLNAKVSTRVCMCIYIYM